MTRQINDLAIGQFFNLQLSDSHHSLWHYWPNRSNEAAIYNVAHPSLPCSMRTIVNYRVDLDARNRKAQANNSFLGATVDNIPSLVKNSSVITNFLAES